MKPLLLPVFVGFGHSGFGHILVASHMAKWVHACRAAILDIMSLFLPDVCCEA